MVLGTKNSAKPVSGLGRLFALKKSPFHFAVERDIYLNKIRSLFLQIYSVFASVSYIAILLEAIRNTRPTLLIWSFSVFAVAILVNLLVYYKRKNLASASNVLLTVIFLVILVGTFYESPLLGGVIWFMPFPLYIFFLKDLRQSFFWAPVSFFLMFVIVAVSGKEIFFTNSVYNYAFVSFLIFLSVQLILFFIDRRTEDLSKYELIARYTSDLIVFSNEHGDILYASPSLAEYFEYSADELTGKSIYEFVKQKDALKLKAAFKNPSKKIILEAYNKVTGATFVMDLTFRLVATPDIQKIYLVSGRDITKRISYEKELQKAYDETKKFKLAVENASDHIVITDPEGIVLFANKGVENITGYSPKEVIGTKAGKLWSKPMPHEYYVKLWDTIKSKKKFFSGEITNKRKNGEEYIAFTSISPVLDQQGRVSFFIGIERDITKEKQIDKAKTEFVSLASHQLRTPLSAINWYSEMLLAGDVGKLSKKQKEFVQEVYDGNQRMVDLVNSLLNVSRLELGTFAVEPVKTNIEKIAKVVIKELRPAMKERKIIFKQDTARNIPEMMVDPKLTIIIFQNLLSNAIKYTPEKGKVTLILKVKKPDLIIEVKDTGIGIPRHEQSKIFTKLFRAENVHTSDTEGTGLGLYIIKSIIEQSNGSISFVSTEGNGTTFTVKIPLKGMKEKAGTKGLNPS